MVRASRPHGAVSIVVKVVHLVDVGKHSNGHRRIPGPVTIVVVIALGVLVALGALAAAFPSRRDEAPTPTVAQNEPPGPERIAAIQRTAEELRELQLGHPVVVERLDRSQVRALIGRLSAEGSDPGRVHATDQVLHLLRLLPPRRHLEDLVTDGLAAQVAGLYDPATKRLYVVDGTATTATDSTLLHEIVHALQDGRYNLRGRAFRERPADADGQAAAQAVVEGDATDVQARYIQSAGLGAALGELGGALSQLAEVPADQRQLPPYLQRSLEYAYTRGRVFIAALRAAGGQPAVDRAFEEPPKTTLAILRPARYLNGDPPAQRVRLPRPLVRGARVLNTTFGAFDLLAVGVDEDTAATWRGGRIGFDRRGQRGVVTLVLASTRPGRMRRALAEVMPRTARLRVAGDTVTMRLVGRVPKI